jgi:TPR repeat protein/Zn-dependent protease with chaperone function
MKNLLFATLMFLPISALSAVCESIYDGDKAFSIVQGTPENYTLSLINNSSSASDVTHSQLQAVYNAKEKIQRVVGIYPKFVICGDAEPNAFAFEQQDGAVVGVSVGMLKLLNGDEDMAAAVIGHEIAHHTKNHRLRTQQGELVTNIISSLIGLYIEARVQQTYKIKGVGTNVAAIGSVLTISKFSRDHEREADEVGFRYMIDAGYNPEASIRLAEALLNKGSRGTGLFYDTHPSWDERAARFKTLIAGNSKAQQIIALNRVDKKVAAASSAQPNNQAMSLNSSVTLSEAQINAQISYKALAENDAVKAEKYSRMAADAGEASSQYNLGVMYEKGDVVKKDINEALRLIKLAAAQEFPFAQSKLGFYYLTGVGVAKDEVEGIRLIKLAAEKGELLAQYNLGLSYVNGIIRPPNKTEAVKWWRLAAEQGDAASQASMGSSYFMGNGVKKDLSEALKWYRLAAAQNHAGAQSSLGYMYLNGLGVNKDVVEAFKLIKLSADQSNSLGQYGLGTLYLNGVGVDKNEEEAIKLFKLAAFQGHPLAVAYLNKKGITWK